MSPFSDYPDPSPSGSETPSPSSDDRNRPRHNTLLFWLAIGACGLILLYSARSSVGSGVRTKESEELLMAIGEAKLAYTSQYLAPPNKRGTRSKREEDRVVRSWQRFTARYPGRPVLLRDLGILLFQFGKPGYRSAFARAVAASESASKPAARLQSRTAASRDSAQPADAEPSLPPDRERALWRLVYDTPRVPPALVVDARRELARLHLRWFEHLAAARLYHAAGMEPMAGTERQRALASASATEQAEMFSGLTILAGAALWLLQIPVGLRWLRARPRFERAEGGLDYFEGVLTFTCYLLLMTLGPWRILARVISDLPAVYRIPVHALLSLAIYIPIILVPLALFRAFAAAHGRRLSLADMRAALGVRMNGLSVDLSAALRAVLLLMPAVAVTHTVSIWVFRRFQTPSNPVESLILAADSRLDTILVLLLACVAAPIAEEIMFRGVLYSALRGHLGVARGAAASAAVFSLVHPTLPAGFLPIWVVGVALALVYERTRSLLPGIVVHGIYNAMMIVPMLAMAAK